ncbi:hypothetical protein DFA_04068 [Cavenderia fasciculata]|uniref:Uncharacterized protein n=1 Tax=Cavenderia fasciculata TaxID=261658 RepID=F4Q173_CACFS|nr:uncharacterized protein DFA_04068 [Cavenderia fasciculata]EGG18574.1 hypothetical protein DFA_04068 [Cavenderia fasciculata]|eukprot:XP_004366478.1 hypothetical protein DFA_04068 [Cavenderia fasciculata]
MAAFIPDSLKLSPNLSTLGESTTAATTIASTQQPFNQSAQRWAIPEEGIAHIQAPSTHNRLGLMETIYRHSISVNVTLIKSPPYTRKTSFGQLFHEYTRHKEPETYLRRVSLIWFPNSTPQEFNAGWIKFTGRTFGYQTPRKKHIY